MLGNIAPLMVDSETNIWEGKEKTKNSRKYIENRDNNLSIPLLHSIIFSTDGNLLGFWCGINMALIYSSGKIPDRNLAYSFSGIHIEF